MQNTISVDLEDYFMVENFASTISFQDWENYSLRLEVSVPKLLNLFKSHQVKATFFVLGWVAEKLPKLIQQVSDQGHEIACHGYSHQRVDELGREAFKNEIGRATKLLEDLSGKPVLGYRAATYSINEKTPWIWDLLIENGYRYDSSYRPFLWKYWDGMPINEPRKINTSNGKSILEYPITVKKIGGLSFPFYGGGYFRLIPLNCIQKGIKQLNQEGKPANIYLHPWEVDPDQPRLKASSMARFRHYTNLNHTEEKLGTLLDTFSFSSIAEVLAV